MDVDHFLLGQRAFAHGNQGDDPADERQTELECHGHPEDGRGGRIRGLGHRGGVAQQRHSAGSDHSGKRGDELIDQAVGAGDNGGNITPAAVQLKVDGIRHVRGVGGGDAHIGAVLQKAQHHIDDHGRAAHDADLLGVNDNEEHDQNGGDDHADAGEADNALFAAVLADILGTERCKEDGRDHADNSQNRGKTHIANQNTIEKRADDGLTADLLGQLIRSIGGNVALQGLVVLENLDNIRHLQRLGFLGADKVLRLVERGNTEADQQGADGGNDQGDIAGGGQKCLVVGAAALGQQHNIQNHGHSHGNHVVEYRGPDADGRALARIICHDGGNGLRSHVGDGVADDVNNVQQGKHRQAQPFGREAGEHSVEGECLNQEAGNHQDAQLAELGVDAVIDKGEQGIGDAVQNTGAGQNNADGSGRDAVADAGRITRHADEGIDAHTDKTVAGIADDLPKLSAAVLYAVNF